MDNYGFVKVAAAVPQVAVADCARNAERIVALAQQAARRGVELVAFPELAVTGYTCADLFGQQTLVDKAEQSCADIVRMSAGMDCVLVFGTPMRWRGRLYNCAVVSRGGKIIGIVPKTYLAGNGEFYEPRWFESADKLPGRCVGVDFAGQKDIPFGVRQLFRVGNALFGVEICQDLWSPVPQSTWAALAGAQLIINLSASNSQCDLTGVMWIISTL